MASNKAHRFETKLKKCMLAQMGTKEILPSTFWKVRDILRKKPLNIHTIITVTTRRCDGGKTVN